MLVVSLISAPFTFVPTANAAFDSCEVSVSPTSVNANESVTLFFTVTNSNDEAMKAIRFTSPDGFTLTGGESANFGRQLAPPTITFLLGSVDPGASHEFELYVDIGDSEVESANWTVEASAQDSGGSFVACSGSKSVEITDPTIPPEISGVTTSDITQSGASIQWQTDRLSSSVVEYGPTTAYGQSVESESLITSHSLTLSGLTTNTTYHYRVKSTTSGGGEAVSEDNTFTTSQAPDTSGPELINIRAQAVTDTTATITWETSEQATSKLEYGTSTEYGLTLSDSTRVTNHEIKVTGLTAGTTYHYRVTSVDVAGNSRSSNDNTFVTTGTFQVAATPTPLPTTPTPTPTPEPNVVVRDTTGPVVVISTELEASYLEAPEFTGTARDPATVTQVDYSTDGGENWLPATITDGQGTVEATFTFTPTGLLDDNYDIVVRAFDSRGNVGVSEPIVLVIDQFPPLIGTSIYSVGSQIIEPNQDGVITALAGVDQRITLSAIGGPTEMAVEAVPEAGLAEDASPQLFTLVKNRESGLWAGAVNFTKPGAYRLTAKSVDGANNKDEQQLAPLYVLPPGRVASSGAGSVASAQVTVFVQNPATHTFLPWDGRPHGQKNPQVTDDTGTYSFMLPPDTYYLEVNAPGYNRLRTTIFTLTETTPINAQLTPEMASEFKLGNTGFTLTLPHTTTQVITPDKLSYISQPAPRLPHSLLGQSLPPLSLQSLEGSEVPANTPVLLSLLSPWSPQTSEQLALLNEFAAQHPDIQVMPIFIQATSTQAALIQQQGRYEHLVVAADPTGEILSTLNIANAPTHLLQRADNTIAAVRMGVLGIEEIRHTVQ